MNADALAKEKFEAVVNCWKSPMRPLDRSNVQPRTNGVIRRTTFRTTVRVKSTWLAKEA